ncbi:SDR family oxidoreductase [Amphritea balenae]|uniref:SDR family oxidoreductase n=1 Tax=Amphritea balenae TaxID=452629 RepID=A0A3P1SJ29_9GAMM|nr:SDR family oxidoreductase [Amphritea balenae]RRC97047.1 SDR family oxidoreductase [Amphritea balenae]GGK67561.1 oxidoreductase [Amphritea balenae]
MLQEKVAIVTGSGRGIGAATARLLVGQGYAVCINYRSNRKAAESLRDELEQRGGRVIAVEADVSYENQVVELFNRVDHDLGRVSALVNNAGILLPQMRLDQMDAVRINHLFSSNVTGYFLCCREAVKRMSSLYGGAGGAIVNVSSVASRTGSPGEYIDYAATKGAIDSLTRGLSVEVANEGVRVNAVRPGFIDTQMHADGGEPNRIERLRKAIPMQRGGRVEEIAEAIVWLLSDAASYTTGSFIDLAGGK